MTAIVLCGLLFLLFFLAVRWQAFGPVPRKNELREIRNFEASDIYASGGELLGKFFIYDRTNVTPDEVSPFVIDALIATEDVRFFRHRGIDARSLVRVVVRTIFMRQRSAGGGSTLTMQLSKNLYPRKKGRKILLLADKLREAIIARRLEKIYSKEELLLMYLNTVPFGDNVFGISAAAHRFFNKPPAELAAEEAAMLVGMLKATNTYNPRLHPEEATKRRNTVIDQLMRYGYISREASDSLKTIELVLDYAPVSHLHGPAPYFREWIRNQLAQMLHAYNERNGSSYNLYTDGLKITTTIDYHLQGQAETSLYKRMKQIQQQVDQHYRSVTGARTSSLIRQLMKRSERYASLLRQGKTEEEIDQIFRQSVDMTVFDWNEGKSVTRSPLDSIISSQKLLHAALISIEPQSGNIRAWVGGNDFRFFKYDHVVAKRQAGSAFKPFVFAAALENGVTPCEYISNDSITFPEYNNWTPSNADGSYVGYYSMKGALQKSVNTVAARYLSMAGTDRVISLARRAGIHSDIPVLPSLALGTLDCSLLELTAAYAIFNNFGRAVSPRWLLKVESSEGIVLFGENEGQANHDIDSGTERVISAENSMLMTEMLTSVTRKGTASVLTGYIPVQVDIAGKTGTSNNNADSWFVGYTPGLLTGVWVGSETPAFTAAYPLPFGASGSAVLVWGDFIRNSHRNGMTRILLGGEFDPLPDHLAEMLECADYLEELPGSRLFDRILDILKDETDDEKQERSGRLRRIWRRLLEEVF